jgi:hypothetical protein
VCTTNSQNVPSIVALYSTYTRALTCENFCPAEPDAQLDSQAEDGGGGGGGDAGEADAAVVGRSGEGEGKGEGEGERVDPRDKNSEGGEGGVTSPVSPSKWGGVGGGLGGMEVLVSEGRGRCSLGGERGGGGIGMMEAILPWAPRPGTPVRVQRSHVPPLGILFYIILFILRTRSHCYCLAVPVVQRSHVPPMGILNYITLYILRTRSHWYCLEVPVVYISRHHYDWYC